MSTSPQHVIVSKSYGDIRIYEATLANALNIFSQYDSNISSDIVKLADQITDPNSGVVFYSAKIIGKALKDCLEGHTSKLRTLWYGPPCKAALAGGLDADTRPEITTADIDLTSLKLFLYDNKITDVAYVCGMSDNIQKLGVLNLPCLKPFVDRIQSPICFVDDDSDMDSARTYARIKSDDWKNDPTIAEMSKVRRIISLVNDWTHRDENFEVVKITSVY